MWIFIYLISKVENNLYNFADSYKNIDATPLFFE